MKRGKEEEENLTDTTVHHTVQSSTRHHRLTYNNYNKAPSLLAFPFTIWEETKRSYLPPPAPLCGEDVGAAEEDGAGVEGEA